MKRIHNSEEPHQFKIGDIVSAYNISRPLLITGFSRLKITGIVPCSQEEHSCPNKEYCYSDQMLYVFWGHSTHYCGGHKVSNWEWRKV